jgi:hypothetical protein
MKTVRKAARKSVSQTVADVCALTAVFYDFWRNIKESAAFC